MLSECLNTEEAALSWKPRLGISLGIGIVIIVVAYLAILRDGINADSALIFVGLPLALVVAMAIAPITSAHGRVFQVTTICLLITAVLAHEGAICVLLAAPLVYGVAHGVTGLVKLINNHHRAYALVLPLILLSSVEGVDQDWRVHPVQEVEVVRVVGLDAAEVGRRIAHGPSPAPMESLALKTLGMPSPEHVHGNGIDPGARWTFAYHGSSHGPGGQTVFEVTRRGAGEVDFRIVEDTAITARWFDWRVASMRWTAIDDSHTSLRLVIRYERGLDPSWYFGPLNDFLLHEGGAHLMDMLDLR